MLPYDEDGAGGEADGALALDAGQGARLPPLHHGLDISIEAPWIYGAHC